MTIKEAFDKGLIEVGTRIKTNASYAMLDRGDFSGIVEYIEDTVIGVLRDDGEHGAAHNNHWGINTYNTKAYVEIMGKTKKGSTMTVVGAVKKGLIKVGIRVKTDASGGTLSSGGYFTGVITFMHHNSFDIKRDDGKTGGGTNKTWTVDKFNYVAHIEILTGNICVCCLKDKGEFKIEESYVCKKCIFTIPECKHCGKLVLDSDICPDCKDAFYGICEDCVESFLLEDMKDGYCRKCWDGRIHCCDCGEFIKISDTGRGTDNKLYCRYCFNLKYFICRNCSGTFSINDSHTVGSYKICQNCFDEFYGACDKCGKIFYRDNLIKKGDQYLCGVCHEQSKPHIMSLRADSVKVRQTKKILLGMTPHIMRKFNYYNDEDRGLSEIVNEIGESNKPIYLYGLIDRPEYSFACSPMMLERLNPHMTDGFIETPNGKEYVKVIDIDKPYSLGINMELRLNKFDWVCDFVKKLTNITC